MYTASLIFPRFCFGCGLPGMYLCKRCRLHKLPIIHEQQCHVCKKAIGRGYVHSECREQTSLDGVFVACNYQDVVQEWITQIKYNFLHDAIPELANVFYSIAKPTHILDKGVITFVPMSRKKAWWRGYNQAELLAENVAKYSGLKLEPMLKRKKYRLSQVGKSKEEREKMSKDDLEIVADMSKYKGQDILLIDDVMTTGATLETSAQALRDAGFDGTIRGLVLARKV